MEKERISEKKLQQFAASLRQEEKSRGTVEKYLRDLRAFFAYLGDKELTAERAAAWKEHLSELGYAPVTINSMLASLNSYCRFNRFNIRLKYYRVQRRLFREPSKELTGEEFNRLVSAAQDLGKERLALLMETICASGIRVSEVRYITVEAAKEGKATVSLKGKVRCILLPKKLCRKLLKYAGKQKIASGEIFLTGSGKSLCRRQIWAEMKALCKATGIAKSKVFPHNLRHLFATTFYHLYKDVVRLADVLGHSSVDTTRIYLVTTGDEHRRQLDRLGLVS